jgi:hypothetical protein
MRLMAEWEKQKHYMRPSGDSLLKPVAGKPLCCAGAAENEQGGMKK